MSVKRTFGMKMARWMLRITIVALLLDLASYIAPRVVHLLAANPMNQLNTLARASLWVLAITAAILLVWRFVKQNAQMRLENSVYRTKMGPPQRVIPTPPISHAPRWDPRLRSPTMEDELSNDHGHPQPTS